MKKRLIFGTLAFVVLLSAASIALIIIKFSPQSEETLTTFNFDAATLQTDHSAQTDISPDITHDFQIGNIIAGEDTTVSTTEPPTTLPLPTGRQFCVIATPLLSTLNWEFVA